MMVISLLIALQESGFQEGAPVESTPASGPSFSWVPLVLIGAVFYFVLIAPERKNRRRRETMLSELKKGDRVMTTGGLHGSVAQVQDDVVTLQVADGVRLRFSRAAVQTVVEPETKPQKANEKTPAAS